MPPMNLPRVRFLGRPIKPVAFGLTVALLIIWPSAITNEGVLDGSIWGDFIGWSAFAIAGIMTWAWWKSSQRVTEIGLQLVFALMIFRFFGSLLVNQSWTQAGTLSIAWAIVAGGSFILERSDAEPPYGR